MDRGGLSQRLLDILDSMPNVKFCFNHKLTGADFKRRKAWFEYRDQTAAVNRPVEVEVDFDLMIGADGAHSAVRYHLMKFTRMDYSQEYIDTLWCEFLVQPNNVSDGQKAGAQSKFRISPNHLHIWPGKEFMFVAIPNDVCTPSLFPIHQHANARKDGSFTSTLFMPGNQFATLESDPSKLPAFFDSHFPGVTSLIPPEELISSFQTNPHLPLINIKCSPYHFSDSVVIVGDAAHAMVPFYGQGMNAGFEDVRILFSLIDKHATTERNDPSSHELDGATFQRARALDEYTSIRVADAHAINDLALQNYVEMRASVLSRMYRVRKFLEEFLSVHVPSLGWHTQYSRISFGNERYSEVVAKSQYQGKALMRGLLALSASPLLLGSLGVLTHHFWAQICSPLEVLRNLVGQTMRN